MTGSIVRSVPIVAPGPGGPQHLLADGSDLWLSVAADNTLLRIDPTKGASSNASPSPAGPAADSPPIPPTSGSRPENAARNASPRSSVRPARSRPSLSPGSRSTSRAHSARSGSPQSRRRSSFASIPQHGRSPAASTFAPHRGRSRPERRRSGYASTDRSSASSLRTNTAQTTTPSTMNGVDLRPPRPVLPGGRPNAPDDGPPPLPELSYPLDAPKRF